MVVLGYFQPHVSVIVDGGDDDDKSHFPVRLGWSAGMVSTWDGLLPQVYCLAARRAERVGFWTLASLAPPCDSWLLF